MLRTLLVLVAILISLTACSGDDDKRSDDDGADSPRSERTRRASDDRDDDGDGDARGSDEDDLRETVTAAYKAIFASGAVDAYAFASEDFKAECSLSDFIGVVGLIRVFIGDFEEEDVDVDVTDVREEDDRSFVTVSVALKGESLDLEDDDNNLTQYWVQEDGEWKFGTDDDKPCDSGFDASTGDDDGPAASGPGSSRGEPVPLGDAVQAGDVRITVLSADIDAAAALADLTEFPATPVPGRRVVLVRLSVEHTGEGGDETIQVFGSDYAITGSNNVLYDGFDGESSCGFLEDELQGEMFPGGTLDGYVCYQVPRDETGLLLVASPGFDDEDRRFFALE